MTRGTFSIGLAAVAAAALMASGCTVHEQETPSLTGPSELGTSIGISVSPDELAQDGVSQSQVTITARDANGQPLRSVSLRVDVVVNGSVTTTLGTLSAHNVVTDANGRASLVYTAPSLPNGAPVAAGTIGIQVTPSVTDFANATPRTASLHLVVPPGTVVPPSSGLVPKFTFSPSAPLDHQTVVFDASQSTPDKSPIVSYSWSFGDGRTGSGVTAQHSFNDPGVFAVTLTITDAIGGSASSTQSVTVGQGQAPTASFTVSPTNPIPNQQVFFNASASRAAAGRTIVSYQWDFGDGGAPGSGVQASHTYTFAGGFIVTLTVTDDAGHVGTVSQTVAIGNDAPTADFTFSPTAPTTGAIVNFNASASKAVPGRTIVSYTWSFGDGGTGSGVAATHPFAAPGAYVVTLTVVDDQGKSGTTTKTVTVS